MRETGQRPRPGEDLRQCAGGIGGEVEDDKHRRWQLRRQPGDHGFQRFHAARRRADDDTALCWLHLPLPCSTASLFVREPDASSYPIIYPSFFSPQTPYRLLLIPGKLLLDMQRFHEFATL